ncbi:DUF2399 domain-containing protein [Streptomyces stramineus]
MRHLPAGGARLLYHGDFDWGGLRIAGVLLRTVPWHPWRYTASDCRALVAATPSSRPLTGTPAEAPWDLALAPASPSSACVPRRRRPWTCSSRTSRERVQGHAAYMGRAGRGSRRRVRLGLA